MTPISHVLSGLFALVIAGSPAAQTTYPEKGIGQSIQPRSLKGTPEQSYADISSCSAIQAPQQWDGNHRQGQNPKGARDRPREEREYPPVRLDHGADEVLLQHGAEHHAQDRRCE